MTNQYKVKCTLAFLVFASITTLLMLSSGGCGSGKVLDNTTLSGQADTSSLTLGQESTHDLKKDTNIQDEEKNNGYPIYVERTGNNYLDEYTTEYNGIKMVRNDTETKIIFSNGKILSNLKDATIYKDIPKKAQVYHYSNEDEEYFKEVEVKKLSNTQKSTWLGKMKLHPDIKFKDLDYMIISAKFIEINETPGRICLTTSAEVWSEMGELVGRIAHVDVYDYEGKLILQIPMYEYGGGSFAITKDQKYLLANINGSNLGDNDYSCGLISPQIRIYNFKDGQFLSKVNMPCAGWGFSGRESNFNFSTASLEGFIEIENKIIKIQKITSEIMDGVITQITDKGIITKDGKLWEFQTNTFEEWNKRYEPNFKEKQD